MNDKCTMCGQDGLVKLSSQNTKVCTGCGHEEVWPLDEGQQPLVGSHRQKAKPLNQGVTQARLSKHCGAGEAELSQQVCSEPHAAIDPEHSHRNYFFSDVCEADYLQLDPEHIRRSYSFSDVCEADYLHLAQVLQRAHDQAAYGKGKDRHAKGQPFHEQRMQAISQLLDSEDGMAYQALKKVTEGLELPTTERKVAELLGAINYLAGIVIFLESKDRASAVNIIAGEV